MAIVDLHESAPPSSIPPCDICIIGSGPAGLTLAAELANSGKSIYVLESGRYSSSFFTDKLRAIKNIGEIRIKQNSRERVFGGTSTTWAGLSAPLDPIDFTPRPFMQLSGWPFSYKELEPYYDAASQRYGFAPFTNFHASHFEDAKRASEHVFSLLHLEEKTFIAADPAWNFGKQLKYIFNSPHVQLFLDATVIQIVSERDTSGNVRSRGVRIRNSFNIQQEIAARFIVLATGGIENARLLLASQDICSSGLGNEHDQVGRYLMNHPKNNFGILRLRTPIRHLPYLFGQLSDGWAGFMGLRIRENLQQKLCILNSYIRFEPLFPWTDNPGVWSLISGAKRMRILLTYWKRRQARKKIRVELRDYSETGDEKPDTKNEDASFSFLQGIFSVLRHSPVVLQYVWSRLFSKKAPEIQSVRLRNFMEMEPCAENRVMLSHDVDAHGNRIPVVNLNTSPLDRRSLVELHNMLARDAEQTGIGTLESTLHVTQPWPITFDASHHLGTTRMGRDPHSSVVTPDLRIHSVENVYVLGGSVFPTSGCANPTYTICALAIRLAKFLRPL